MCVCLYYNFYFMYINAFPACICMCAVYMSGDHEGQKKASYLLKVELHIVVSCHVDAGN